MIVRTKLNRPPPPPDLVPRKRLANLLQSNPDRSLTLVSAPAGYGKSTLVSRWLDIADISGVWLSLDEEDNELRFFINYFIEAVRMHSPKACRHTYDLLEAAELPPPTVLADYLINDLERIKRPFILVIDDYHRIYEQAVHDLMGQLLRHPCQPFHLTLITRHDPPLALAGLRAHGQMLEIRETDLRFTIEESRKAITSMSGVLIGEETMTRLHNGIEGWIAGLRLVCLSLRHQTDPEAFLNRLDGGTPGIQEYLLEEVLKQLTPDFQQCLLKTSILNRFCAPLCETLCSEENPSFTGKQFLQELEKANLFAVPLDARGEWFRYHHLFQDLLLRLLEQRHPPDEIQKLHECAARWFALNGLVDEALDHALAAKDPELAADIVEAHRVDTLNADKWPILASWLALLPQSIISQRPELLLGEAWIAYYRFRIPELARIIETLDPLIQNDESRPAWEGECSLFKSYLLYWQGMTQKMLIQVVNAQELLPDTHDLMRADSEIYFGLAHHMAGEKELAIKALTRRIREQPDLKGLMITRRVITLAFIHVLAGDLNEATVYSRQLGELAQLRSPVYITSWSTFLLGCCHFQSGQWAEAERCFRWMIDNRYVSHTATIISSLVGLGLIQEFTGRSDDASSTAKQLMEFAVETKDPANLVLAESGSARIKLLQAEAGTCPVSEDTGMATAFLFLEVPPVSQCRLLIARGSERDLRQALEVLDALQESAENLNNTFQLIDIVVLKTVAHHKLGQADQSKQELNAALNLAAPGQWVRPFIEAGTVILEQLQEHPSAQAKKIIQAFPQITTTEPQASPRLIETLTHRERDVLDCLAERLYDKEIAEKLSISLNTVKTHLRHIYEKLGAGNRREASSIAERLGILNHE